MVRKFIVFLLMIMLAGVGFSVEEVDLSVELGIDTEDVYADLGEVALEEGAGLTPDSMFYFIDEILEGMFFDETNPEEALAIKEEKINEAKAMIEKGDVEAAKIAFKKAKNYAELIESEVTPEIEKRVRESSKAVKNVFDELSIELSGDEWEEVRELVSEQNIKEDKIALAAKVSSQIKNLCKSLATLDPLEYSRICKTDSDDAGWKQELDRELSSEQEVEAKQFFEIMTSCFEDPRNCQCDRIKVKSFSESCSEYAPLVADCDDGNGDACEKLDTMEDPIDLLPPHLIIAMEKVEQKFKEKEFEHRIPQECVDEGATSREACEKLMFEVHAPIECLEAMETGNILFDNERDARYACDKLMFELDAPEACLKAGLDGSGRDDWKECDLIRFREDAPQECIDAGITGSGRDDWKKCDAIKFKMDAPQECLDAGLDGTGRDDWKKCEPIRFKLEAPQACIEAGLDGSGRDDWKKCDTINFKNDAPQACLDAGITGDNRDDWKKCEAIKFRMDAPQECLDAGLDGTGRDDWRACEPIKFKMSAPQECLDAGLDGTGRDDMRKCDAIRFKLEAPQACLDAGIDGSERDPWRACEPIRFKDEAPQECLDAGLDGTGRDDWKKCNVIRFKLEAPQACLDAGITGDERDPWRACDPIRFKDEAPKECLDAGLDGTGRDDWDKCHKIQEGMHEERREEEEREYYENQEKDYDTTDGMNEYDDSINGGSDDSESSVNTDGAYDPAKPEEERIDEKPPEVEPTPESPVDESTTDSNVPIE